MKMIKVAENLLKYMVKEYKRSNQTLFFFSDLREQYPELSDDFISDALYLLESDGFVSVSPADNVAFITSLLPNGVRNCEENTLLKKGYTLLKEIKSLLPLP